MLARRIARLRSVAHHLLTGPSDEQVLDSLLGVDVTVLADAQSTCVVGSVPLNGALIPGETAIQGMPNLVDGSWK